jgi:hypothetical protein
MLDAAPHQGRSCPARNHCGTGEFCVVGIGDVLSHKNLSEFLKGGWIVRPHIWGRFITKLMGTDRPGEGIVQGTDRSGTHHQGTLLLLQFSSKPK